MHAHVRKLVHLTSQLKKGAPSVPWSASETIPDNELRFLNSVSQTQYDATAQISQGLNCTTPCSTIMNERCIENSRIRQKQRFAGFLQQRVESILQ